MKKDSRIIEKGKFISNPKGFGFVEVEGRNEDIFIPESKTAYAFYGDVVEVVVTPSRAKGKRDEGEIIRITEHSVKTVVGTYDKSNNFGFVIPDNSKIGTDIFIAKGLDANAKDRMKVVCELTFYGDNKRRPEGIITKVLGYSDEPGVDVESVIENFGVPTEFTDKALAQAARCSEIITQYQIEHKKDYRDLLTITIDGEDAKDFDDAVSLCMDGDAYILGVHIADVSEYVQENSELDRNALSRATSIYLADRVIPMLPEYLCNGVCSLMEGVDRLTLSCTMRIAPSGKITDYRIEESIIRSKHRMTYTKVQMILDGDEKLREEYEDIVPMLEKMAELSGILRNARHKRGAVDFDFPECKLVLDDKGRVTDIVRRERNKATKLIEDFMLAANETVAEHFFWLEEPFVYRCHETPDTDKMRRLSTFLTNFGYHIVISDNEVHPKEIQKLLDKIEGAPEEALISRLCLQSLRQAKYTVDNYGHFGLACKYYCHFTSPIRRYPDLQIHRIIKEYYRKGISEDRKLYFEGRLPEVAKTSSEAERRADDMERQVEKIKKAQFMCDKIGKGYEGVISGVTSFGLFVELSNTVEGLIRIESLPPDSYIYDETKFELFGTNSGICYKLGQTIKISVAYVDTKMWTVDFVPEDENE